MGEELDRLRQLHQTLDRRLKELEEHRWLSPDDEIEVTRLKKEKLATKDQIARLEKKTT